MATNVKYVVKGNILTITCDIGTAALNAAKPSGTGKTNLVASTHGSEKLNDEGLSFSINVMQKN